MLNFIGYHGTGKNNAKNILRTNFKVDFTKVGWLGTGIYFFHEGKELAEYWASRKFANYDVFRCEIEVPEEKVFDVTDPLGYNNQLFHAIRKELINNQIQLNKIDIIVKNKEDLDGKVYNLICKKKGYQLVRAATYTYNEEDREYGLFSRVPNGVELCLKNPSYVKTKNSIYEYQE
jgi:hypothetical protein